MSNPFSVRRGLTTAALVALAVTAGPAVSASADTAHPPAPAVSAGSFDLPGWITLCSDGGYNTVVMIPAVWGYYTDLYAAAGTCESGYVGPTDNVEVDVYGDGGYIGSTIFNGADGETLTTVAGPSFYVS
jgi:hypothetical protein